MGARREVRVCHWWLQVVAQSSCGWTTGVGLGINTFDIISINV
jgi:hypothetical protein